MTSSERFAVFARLAFCLLCCVCTPPPVVNQQLVNGNFEQALTSGWQAEATNSRDAVFERSDTFHPPDSSFAVKVTQKNVGIARLSQIVELPGANYILTCDARFSIGGSMTCNPIAAIVVSYLSTDNAELGSTCRYLSGPYCPWRSSRRRSLHPVTVQDQWLTWRLEIATELARNLPDVNRELVRRLRIAIEPQVESSG